MAEPESLLVEGARLATIAARDLWWRLAPPRERTSSPSPVSGSGSSCSWARSTSGRHRSCPPTHRPLPRGSLASRGAHPVTSARQTATAATDGAHIWLPRAVESSEGEARAVEHLRLLAVEMAARADRGTPRHAPPEGSDPLVRDLYLLAEAVAIDRAIANLSGPRAGPPHGARRAALDERPHSIDSPPWSVPSSASCATS